jgi:hypothetical protein
MGPRWPRHTLPWVAGVCALALTVLAVALYLIPSVAPPAPVTIESIDWQIQQSTFDNGTPEFTPLWINQSGPVWGFPFHVASGASFNDSLIFADNEPVATRICTVSVTPPLFIVSMSPALPMTAEPAEDSQLTLEISVHASAGALVNGLGVLNALGC